MNSVQGSGRECPADATLKELILDTLSERDQQSLEDHLTSCQTCQQRLGTLVQPEQALPRSDEYQTLEVQSDELKRAIERCKDVRFLDSRRASLSSHEILDRMLGPSEDPEVLGKLARYDVLEFLGQGGMGIVVRARDPSLDRTVAIKALLPAFGADPAARDRFVREARAAASMQHPNVVTIYAVEDTEQPPLLVMECIEGETLRDRMEREKISLDELESIALDVISGLGAAHQRNLIHRDIKPSNVLIDAETGTAKLSDFGLAKAVDENSQLTTTGAIVGTPEFMSPEQAESDAPVDARSDLFSLGTLLYTVASGKSPFRAGTAVATIRRIADHTPQPLCEVAPQIPKWFGSIVDRLMQRAPEDRFQTAAAVADAIRTRSGHGDRQADTAQNHAISRKPWVLGGVATAMLCLLCCLPLMLPADGEPSAPDPTSPAGSSVFERPGFYTPDFVRHLSLREAINAAPRGATVVVQADEPVAIEGIEIHDKPLRIQAAQGATPVLVSMPGNNRPALLSDSELTVEGLSFRWTFDAHAPAGVDRAVVASTAGPLHINHCDFEVPSRSVCVGTNGPATIQNCRFSSPDGTAVYFRPNAPVSVTVDNCAFSGRAAFAVTGDQSPDQPALLAIAGCSIQTESAIELIGWYPETRWLNIDSEDNVIAVSSYVFGSASLFGFFDNQGADTELKNQIAWRSDRRNRYVGDTTLLMLKRRRGRSGYSINELQHWQELWSLDDESTIVIDASDTSLNVRDPSLLGPEHRKGL